MQDWLSLTLVALCGYAALNFIFKLGVERGVPSLDLILVLNVVAAAVCGLVSLQDSSFFIRPALLLALSLLGGLTYFANVVCRLEALKHIDTTVAFPLIRMDIVLAVLFSLFYLGESVSLPQAVGIAVGILVVLLAAGESGQNQERDGDVRLGVSLSLASALASAANVITCRYAARLVNFPVFLALLFLIGALLAHLFALQTRRPQSPHRARPLMLGSLAGIANALAAVALLTALRIGPLATISVVNGQSFILTIALAVLVFREPLSARKICAITGAALSVLLLNA